MEGSLIYNRCVELPDAYEAQLMVRQEKPGNRPPTEEKETIYRARVWIGTTWQRDPMAYWSQEHRDPVLAVDACYRMLLAAAPAVIKSLDALGAVAALVDEHFSGAIPAGEFTYPLAGR